MTSKISTGIATARMKLVLLTATLIAAICAAGPAAAAVTTVVVSAQSGLLTYGTAGSATYTVTLTRTLGDPPAPTVTVTGLPAGATAAFGALSAWTPATGTGTATVALTISTTAAANAGTYPFTVTADNLSVADPTGAGSLFIRRRAQTITFGALADKTFGDPDFLVSASATSGLPVSFAAAGNCTAVNTLPLNSTATVHITGAGSCTITASQAGNSNYFAATAVPQTFAIAKANQTISFGPLADRQLNAPDFALTGTASSGLPLTYIVDAGSATVCTLLTGNIVHLTGISPPLCSITASQAGNANYNAAANVTAAFTILPGTATITFGPAPLAEFPGPNFTVHATTNSDGALTYSYVSGPCTLADGTAGTFTPTAVGACVVRADTVATAAYMAATAQQTVNITPPKPNFYAVNGSTVIGGVTVPVRGYTADGSPATQPGGPTLVVNQGDTVEVILHNNLTTESTGLLFHGQNMVPDTTGIAPGATKSYSFVASQPGTYLYEAALLPNAEHQVAMGLYGALIVRPTGVAAPFSRTDANVTTVAGNLVVTDASATAADVGASVSGPGIAAGTTIASVTAPSVTLNIAATASGTVSLVISKTSGQAYADATTAFDEESTLVLSEIDPVLNGSADPTTFDMREFAPKYFLINGKAYPDTPAITSAAGHKLLLRYVNAGSRHHSMSSLGLRQNFIAKDGSVLPTGNVAVTAETLASGQTGDALVTMPATLTVASQFAVYDASLNLHNSSDQGIGGMLTFVKAGADSAAAGPVTSGVAVTPTPTNGSAAVTLKAIETSAASTIAAAEYFVDAPGANGSGTAMTGTFGSASAAVTATLPTTALAALSSGKHSLYVHGLDATGAWGSVVSTVLNLDKTGPTISALTVTPNPSTPDPVTGAVKVALKASASDVSSGGANITAAEYTVDGGAAVPMVLGGAPAPVRALTASITAVLAAGPHDVVVRAQDFQGNWSATSLITLTVTAGTPSGGPTTSSLSLLPGSSNNGSYGVTSSQPVLRVLAHEARVTIPATVAGAEGFIDSCPVAATRGFPFVPRDGQWGGVNENVSADIPLATINNLSAGTHMIYVRGRDSASTWGDCVSTPLLIDKTAPTLSGGSISPAAVAFGAATATLNFTATDAGAGVAGVQYWFDTATPPANPKFAAGTTSAALSLTGVPGGVRTVYFRARDAANNVSTVLSASLTIVRAVNDARNITANTTSPQTSDTTNAQRVLANDLPGTGTRTAVLLTAAGRISGTGNGTLSVSCPVSLGTAGATVGGNTICTNGAYRATLTGATAAAKRGQFRFTYQMNLAGTLSNPATVTIRVQ